MYTNSTSRALLALGILCAVAAAAATVAAADKVETIQPTYVTCVLLSARFGLVYR